MSGWSTFFKVSTLVSTIAITLSSILVTFWQSVVGMIRCAFCGESVSQFFKNIGMMIFNSQKFIYDSVAALKNGVNPDIAGYYMNQIILGSIMTILFLVIVFSLYAWMASRASMNIWVWLAMVVLAFITIYVAQILYTHFALHKINWMPFYGWIELFKNRNLILDLSASNVPGVSNIVANITQPQNILYV